VAGRQFAQVEHQMTRSPRARATGRTTRHGLLSTGAPAGLPSRRRTCVSHRDAHPPRTERLLVRVIPGGSEVWDRGCPPSVATPPPADTPTAEPLLLGPRPRIKEQVRISFPSFATGQIE